jgi:hypothetical protein
MIQHVAREISNLDSLDRWVESGSVRRVPDTESDDERTRRVIDHQQRHVRECAHVTL